MIKMYQYRQGEAGPNYSPFCAKLETYLKLAELPYETLPIDNPGKGPKGKLPFIEDGDTTLADSTFIIEYLKQKYGDKLDSHLSPEQAAVSLAFQRMLEDNLIQAQMYFRWIAPSGWARFSKKAFAGLPPVISSLVPPLIRGKVRKALWSQGMERHSHDEVLAIAARDFKALSTYLGDKKFFFGDRPSSLDATIFGVFFNIMRSTSECPLSAKLESFTNLVALSKRIEALAWSSTKN